MIGFAQSNMTRNFTCVSSVIIRVRHPSFCASSVFICPSVIKIDQANEYSNFKRSLANNSESVIRPFRLSLACSRYNHKISRRLTFIGFMISRKRLTRPWHIKGRSVVFT